LGSAASEGRAFASYGATTISGPVFLGSGGAQIFIGSGNWIISGLVSGLESSTDRLIKSATSIGSTLWLQNANNNFRQSIRLDAGTVRVSSAGALGVNALPQALDFQNGTLEIRSDSPAGFAGRNMSIRNNAGGTVFIDHDLSGPLSLGAGPLQNQTFNFGNLIRATGANNSTATFTGRNGFNFVFAGALASLEDHRSWTFNNNSSGSVTLLGNVWNTNATGANVGTLTFGGGGEFIVTGSVTTAAADHALTKTGSGTAAFTQTVGVSSSSFLGNTNINDGTLEIRTVEVLNSTSSSRIVLGGGALSFLGASGTGAGQAWSTKTLDVAVANSYVLANQSGSAPTGLILPNAWASSSTAAKTLNLGGSASPPP
jgi:hypothetical protein